MSICLNTSIAACSWPRPAVDEDHVGIQFVVQTRLAITAADDFLDAQVVVVPLAVLDFVAAVAVFEGNSVKEADFAADHFAALQVGDVESLPKSAAVPAA